MPPPSESLREPQPLRSPVSIITPVSEVELHEGSLLIGRLPECDVMIDDALVSRMHARVSVRDDSVVAEDLHSTNGVYVNGVRITHSALLREGDRLLIGTTEVSLFEARPDARLAPLRPRRDLEKRPSPAPVIRAASRVPAPTTLPARGRDSFGRLELHLDELTIESRSASSRELGLPHDGPPSARSADLRSIRSRAANVPSTARADALEVIGALAERLAGSGNLDEARRVLSSHLKRILQGATAGLTVPEDVCSMASRHALSLARWTSLSTWIDYVVELHLVARRAMSSSTFGDFESAVLSVGDFDRQLFGYYVESLRDEHALLTAEEQRVLERLERLNAL
ncbi:MAG TPA: FHA domain-containing protein [Polyangiaceae bacterium]